VRDLLFIEAGLLLAGRKRDFPSAPLGGKYDSPASPILSFFLYSGSPPYIKIRANQSIAKPVICISPHQVFQ